MQNYSGKTIFLGIDVHKRTYSVTAICEGCIVKQDTFIASPEAIVSYCLRAFKGATIKSAYEAGFCGFFLHRFLQAHNIQNIVVHPASIEIESRNHKKTDKRDSKKIATQLSAGRLHSVFIPTAIAENRRYISRLRENFVKQRIRTATQIKSLLNLNGVLSWNESPKISKTWLESLMNLDLDVNLKFCLQKLTATWIYFSTEVSNIDKQLKQLLPEEQELFNSYRKIPGIGPKIACTLVHELGDTMQFSNEEKLFSFCGLTPSEYSSGEHIRRGHITRQGNPILRKMLVQAAWVAIRKDPYSSELFNRLKVKKGACRAIVVIARKLIGKARCAIKKKELYLSVKAGNQVILQENLVAASSLESAGH